MKRISLNIFFLVILLLIFIGLAPRFIILAKVHDAISEKISENLGSGVSIENMHWIWLPLPHLALRNTNITGEQYELFITRVNFYPSWGLILGRTLEPGKIILENPKLRLHKTISESAKPAAVLKLPQTTLAIKNGELEIEAVEEYSEILQAESLKLSNINGKLRLQAQKVEVDLEASSPFSRNISLQGTLNIPESIYRFSLETDDFKLHNIAKNFLNGALIPLESTAGFKVKVTGKGLQDIDLSLQGTLPSCTFKQQNGEINLTFGFADIKLLRSGTLLRLDINDLEIKDPQANLSGRIERKLAATDGNEQFSDSDPIWTLDLVGGDLDLTAIRQKVLNLWSDIKVARIVCNIVRGGRALSAAYRFSGRIADFKNLDTMIIEADVLSADIYVPGAKLDLTKASGPILIKDSVLTGHSLKAQLGDSYGRNAKLLLGLTKKHTPFTLDIEIDGDMAALPPILARLVKHDGFQLELKKFAEVAGRASGSLHLGDSLAKITTQVDVNKVELEARYNLLPEKIFIDTGSLHIDPGKVHWQNARGRIGRQEILNTSGNVSWRSGESLLNIEEAEAQLDGASLLALLKQTDALPAKISKMISALNGTIKVTRGSLKGPVLKPGSWEYDFGLTTTELILSSPLLPEPARTEEMSATIRQGEADIQETAIHFLDQTFNINGLLKHQHFENWHGEIEFNGPVKNKLAEWINSKRWIPDRLQPRIPCTMKNLKIDWQGKSVAVTGILLQGSDGGKLPMARFDFENIPEHLHINELSFYAPGEQGRLEFDLWRRSPRKFILVWQGFVNTDTIYTLFQNIPLTSGSFSGDIEINYFVDQPDKTRFVGLLKTENLFVKTKRPEDLIIIKNLDMTGIGRQLTIPALEIAIGSEKITGSGQVMAEKDILQLDINLASSFLSKQSLNTFSQALFDTQNGVFNQTDEQPVLQLMRGWDINGRIGFDFDSFALNRKTNIPYEGAQSVVYTFNDVQGELQLAPDKISRTEIFSAKLCGLGFKGTWFSSADLGQNFQFFTAPDETLRLENVLPCLGVKQDIIEGEFSVQANLLKESDTWYSGNIYLKSSQGRILRLKTLSRIFKVVNVTDLFEQHVENGDRRGFPFTQMDIDTHIHEGNLIIDRGIIRGEGLNLFARGEVNLVDYDADLALLIAPFKTFDSIISKVPIIGEPVMGEYGSRITIPVAVKGPINDPSITPLHPEAIGKAFFDIVKDTFMLPYTVILRPLEESGQNTDRATPDK